MRFKSEILLVKKHAQILKFLKVTLYFQKYTWGMETYKRIEHRKENSIFKIYKSVRFFFFFFPIKIHHKYCFCYCCFVIKIVVGFLNIIKTWNFDREIWHGKDDMARDKK